MKALFFFSLVLFSVMSSASSVSITGRVVDENYKSLAGVVVEINNVAYKTNTQGKFTVTPPADDVYQIRLIKPGFYESIQTFSHYELKQLQQKEGVISPITLVEKIKGRTLLSFGGDVMMGRRYAAPKFNNSVLISPGSESEDTKAIVQHVKPYMSIADYAAVNLETQISAHKPKERAPKGVTFFSPPQTLDALAWAGIDYVTLGNNHTYDYLDEGLISTLKALNNSVINYSGAGLNQEKALKAHRVNLNGTPFSMLGFVGWEGGFSPNQTAGLSKGGAAFGSLDNLTKTVIRESALSRSSIVQYHGSQEYASEPTLMTEQRLKSAIDVGADLAIAHHPHVTQGFEIYKGKLIAYSMGNFIFDQYFYSTPHSFILNVWMDGESFHRAEIVPIYLKGYKPTPATGLQRSNVLKRLTTLSKKRGVSIDMSGGHGVIVANKTLDHSSSIADISLTKQDSTSGLFAMPAFMWQKPLTALSANDKSLAYRLGTNLVNGGAFESFDLFSSNERGWNIDQSEFSLSVEHSASGTKSMKAILPKRGKETLAMTNFRRVYKGGNPMTVNFNTRVKRDTTVRIYWQGRKKREKLNDALNGGKMHLIGEYNLAGKDSWNEVIAPFNTPRVGYRSLRVLVEFENETDVQNAVFIDDLSFIQWNSAFSSIVNKPASRDLIKQASFIEFNRVLSEKENVTLSFE